MPANDSPQRGNRWRSMLAGIGDFIVGGYTGIDPGFSRMAARGNLNRNLDYSMRNMSNSLEQRMPGVSLRGNVGPNPNLPPQQIDPNAQGQFDPTQPENPSGTIEVQDIRERTPVSSPLAGTNRTSANRDNRRQMMGRLRAQQYDAYGEALDMQRRANAMRLARMEK